MEAYHDSAWGVPLHDDRALFEALILEGAQAGLSWDTILRKRENYRAAFDGFDATKVAGYDERRVASLMANSGIVRNRLKIMGAVRSARAFVRVQEEVGSFDRYIWSLAGDRTRVNHWRAPGEVPARSPESGAMSRDLKARGFTFVGPTTCYAFMQATGMVDDHTPPCFRAGGG